MARKSRTEAVQLDQGFAYHINRVYRLLRMNFLKVSRESGRELTPEQFFLLNKLLHNPGQSQTELAADLNDRANVTRGLDVLEKSGLVERRSDPNDRRRYQIFLTQQGEGLLDQLHPAIVEERKVVYAGLTKSDLDDFRRIIDRLESNLRGRD